MAMTTMPNVASKSLKASTELTLIADIKPGFVTLPDPMSYATRLKKLLSALFDSRKSGVEGGRSGFVGALEKLRSIHFVRWASFDDDKKLLLAVSFDRPWEPYIRLIVDDAGPILDVIFSHCEGYDGHSTRDGYEKFAEWVRERQKACDFFFAVFPGMSVDDVHYLKNLERKLLASGSGNGAPPSGQAGFDQMFLDARVDDDVLKPLQIGPQQIGDFYRTTASLYRLRSIFPANPVKDPAYSDRAVFDRACSVILRGFASTPQALPDSLLAEYRGIDAWYAATLQPPTADPIPAAKPPSDLQQGILESHEDNGMPMTHGCVVLLEVGSDPGALLDYLLPLCGTTDPGTTRYNVAFTPQGLRRICLKRPILAGFPPEFIEGMEARAGLLGDLGTNHPKTWKRPTMNLDWANGDEVQLSSVDAVVILQRRIEGPPVEGDHVWSEAHPLRDEVFGLAKRCKVVHVQALRRYPKQYDSSAKKSREHFGFLDGFSQPELRTSEAKPPGRHEVALGEVLLGQLNDRKEGGSDQDDVRKNGSFLVLRKLSQNVGAFREFVKGKPDLATKMMGRSYDGVAATVPTPSDNDFDYRQDPGTGCPLQSHVRLSNPRTPDKLSAHGKIKRTPRIIRRGFSYGSLFDDSPDAERGLMFMAFNASIAQQYEVIQRWLNGANSTGLDSSQRDPISGPVDLDRVERFRYRNGAGAAAQVLPKQPFVKLEWGMYLFVPSLGGLKALRKEADTQPGLGGPQAAAAAPGAGGTPEYQKQQVLALGDKVLAALPPFDPKMLADKDLASKAATAWRLVLEEQGSSDKAFALLSAIQKKGPVLRTPLGVLVVGAQQAMQVLTDEGTYSVREYWRRMKASSMPMYLGMDANPEPRAVCPMDPNTRKPRDADYINDVKKGLYEQESLGNEFVNKITRSEAFAAGLRAIKEEYEKSASRVIQDTLNAAKALQPPGAPPAKLPPTFRVTTDLWGLAERVVSRLSQDWFAVPDGKLVLHGGQPSTLGDQNAYCPVDFTLFSQFVFRPEPDEMTEKASGVRGARVSESAAKVVQAAMTRGSFEHPFLRFLHQGAQGLGLDPAQQQSLITRSVVGVVDGFVAANFGSFLSVVGLWMKKDEFWRIQRELEKRDLPALVEAVAKGADAAKLVDNDSALMKQILGTLKTFPKPAWLHRVAVKQTSIGGVSVSPGDRVIVHLGTAAFQLAGPDMLFGGPYDYARKKSAGPDRTPLHACPGKELALGVLMGMLVGILSLRNVRAEGTLTISSEVPLPQLPGVAPGVNPTRPALSPPTGAASTPASAQAAPQNPVLLSLKEHRVLIGCLGAALPVLLWIFARILPVEGLKNDALFLDSVSAYFHTGGVAVFCGMLFALAGFLLSYRGYDRDKSDRRVGKLGGVAAMAIAIFPTRVPPDVKEPKYWHDWMQTVHWVSGAVFFICLIVFSAVIFRRSEDAQGVKVPRATRPGDKRFRDDICLLCGIVMGAGLLACVWNARHEKPILVPEVIAIWAFSLSWFVKADVRPVTWLVEQLRKKLGVYPDPDPPRDSMSGGTEPAVGLPTT